MDGYLLDSNSFMTPARLYYNYEILPTYWNRLSEAAQKFNNLYLLDLVENEINKGCEGDFLKTWLSDHPSAFKRIKRTNNSEIILCYQQVMQYIQECGYYTDKGLKSWAQEKVADPWLIAVAMVYGFTIVTMEVPGSNLSPMTPQRSIKIPDVAKHFDVPSYDLFTFMRLLGIKI
jgi:hypothetical protein